MFRREMESLSRIRTIDKENAMFTPKKELASSAGPQKSFGLGKAMKTILSK